MSEASMSTGPRRMPPLREETDISQPAVEFVEAESADEGDDRPDSTSVAGLPEPIYFTDCIGRSFKLPWANAKTSTGMDNLVRAAFLEMDSIYALVVKGRYFICLEDGWRIPRKQWDLLIKPGMRVMMQLLSEEADAREETAPPPQPNQGEPEPRTIEPEIIEVSPPANHETMERERTGPDAAITSGYLPGRHHHHSPVRSLSPPPTTSRPPTRHSRARTNVTDGWYAPAAGLSKSKTVRYASSILSDDALVPSPVERTTTSYRFRPHPRKRETQPQIFSAPSATASPQLNMRLPSRQLSFPRRANPSKHDQERRFRIHSARSYEREDAFAGSFSRHTHFLYSEIPDAGDVTRPRSSGSKAPDNRDSSVQHWIHIQRKTMDFEEFESLCRSSFAQLGLPFAALTRLFRRIEDQYGVLQGGSISPGAVIRCDGGFRGNFKESVIFATVPYIQARKLSEFREGKLGQHKSHPSRPLYESISTFGGQLQRDRDQMFLKYDGRANRHALWVSHVWMILTGSTFMTYGDVSDLELCGKLISLVREDPPHAKDHLTVEFQLPRGEVVIIPVEKETSFFAFQAIAQEHIFQSEGSYPLEMPVFVGPDGKPVDPESWNELRTANGRVMMRLGVFDEEDDDDSALKDGDTTDPQSEDEDTTATDDDSLAGHGALNIASLDQVPPGLPRYDAVPPFLSWNSPQAPSGGSHGSLLEMFEVLNYVNSNLSQTTVLEEIIGSVGDINGVDIVGSDIFARSPENSHAEAKSKMRLLISPSAMARVESEHSLLSPLQRIDEAKELLLDVFQATNYLVDAFTPRGLEHTVIWKVYGAIVAVHDIIESFQSRQQSARPDSRTTSQDELRPRGIPFTRHSQHWVICELPQSRRTLSMRHVRNASDIVGGCVSCKNCTIWETEKAALKHLRDEHLTPGADVPRNTLREFLVPARNARESLKIIHLTLDLRKCKDRLLRLCRTAAHIQGGLLSDGKFTKPLSGLPSGVILAFERVILFMCCMGNHATYIDTMFNPSPFSQLTSLSAHSLSRNVFLLDRLAQDAERYLHRAQGDIVSQIDTGRNPQRGTFFLEVGPRFVVGQMMSNLVWSRVVPRSDIVQVYNGYLRDIKAKCQRRPDKRQLQHLKALADEMARLMDLTEWQLGLFAHYEGVCDPFTYSKTPITRRHEFTVESGLFRTQRRSLTKQWRGFQSMVVETEELRQHILEATDIERDDLNRTILAFTIVTIVFLPLSFVTSYLGMNTTFSDGDWAQTEALFWKSALPLTVALGLFCLLLAFWEKVSTWIREQFEDIPLVPFNFSTWRRRQPVHGQPDEPTATPAIRPWNLNKEKASPNKKKVRARVTFADDSSEEIMDV